MYLYRIPWGGSLALTREFLEQTGIREVWAETLFDDSPLPEVARKHGFRIAPAVPVLVPGDEETDLRSVSNWLPRQLLDLRLYHPAFPLTVLHCLGTNGLLLATLILAGTGFGSGWWWQGGIAALLLVAYLVFYGWSLTALHEVARTLIERRQGKRPHWWPSGFQTCVGVVVTQLYYPVAMLRAMIMRRIRWRGVDYSIRGPRRIRVIGRDDEIIRQPVGNQSIER